MHTPDHHSILEPVSVSKAPSLVPYKKLFLGALLATSLTACPNSEQKTESPPAPTDTTESAVPIDVPYDLEKHKTAQKIWMDDARALVKRLNNARATEVMNLLENSVLARPMMVEGQMGQQFMETAKSTQAPWVGLIIVLADEQFPSDEWRAYAQDGKFAAAYQPAANSLIMRDKEAVTKIWRSIMVLHEGHHALMMKEAPYDHTDPAMFAKGERDTHDFENTLMASIGGQGYKTLLAKEVERIGKLYRDSKKEMGEAVVQREVYNPAYDQIFGKSLSKFESDLRATHIWIHAYFAYIEKELAKQGGNIMSSEFQDHVAETQANFLRQLYKDSGIVQEGVEPSAS